VVHGRWNYGTALGATDSGGPSECSKIVFILTGKLPKEISQTVNNHSKCVILIM